MIQWSLPDARKFDTLFQAAFSAPLIQDVREYETSTEVRGAPALVAYNPAALSAAFRRLYVKPTDSLCDEQAQAVYDRVFRGWIRSSARILQQLTDKENGRWLPRVAAAYEQAALTNPAFDGTQTTGKLANEAGIDSYQDERLVGLIVRRQIDGTLPTIREILAAVLKDYDPTFSAKPTTASAAKKSEAQ